MRGSVARNETVDQASDDRHLQQATTVKLVNNCGYDAEAYIVFELLDVTYHSQLSRINDGRSVTIRGVSDPKLWVYGIRLGNEQAVWTSTNSDLCISPGKCFRQIELQELTAGSVIQHRMCGSNDGPILGAPPSLSGDAAQWISEHNSRRTQFYAQNNMGPLDIKWAPSLATSAENYANTLIGRSGCQISHGFNGDSYGGENLAMNWGSGSAARALTIPQVMTAWYDEEINLPTLGQKLHATQVVWRSSPYLGCGRAEKDFGGGKCFITVCRYVANGNCFTDQTNWIGDVLSPDISRRCNGDKCESLAEGCF